MTWPAARAALAEAVRAVPEVSAVLTAAPSTAEDLPAGVFAVVPDAPAARTNDRRPSGGLATAYRLGVSVCRVLSSDAASAGAEVDAAVEAVTLALEGHTALGGAVTRTTAPDWAEAAVVEEPPGSGVNVVVMGGTLEATVIRTVERGA